MQTKKARLGQETGLLWKLMVAQVFNLCTGGVLLSPGGTGFQPVNPLRIIGSQAGTPAPLRLNARVRDDMGIIGLQV